MGKMTVSDTIREISRRHLEENNGLLLGQAISAVGWVNNTVPNCKGVIEMPMTDVAGAGIAVGAAMVGRRPILVIRFQDFLILNGSQLIFYAAKSKELHKKSTPIFVRAIASDGIGPVHSGVLHSVFMHFPGFRVCSPMTPNEYKSIWHDFMIYDDPMIVSEHRASFSNTEEFEDIIHDNASITLYPISVTRFEAMKAAAQLAKEGILCNVIHILWLKPFVADKRITQPLLQSECGIVIDVGHEIAGASQSIAYQLTQVTGILVKALGLKDSTKCLCHPFKNEIPTAEQISDAIRNIHFINNK
ncbi:MAG: hypothetical protein LBK93_03875 [Rickettsiales bacterium]|jgi:pyruvate/2-oxoglutarate/acetoin dehydrogenase E1 component|nr:hypothetical protein [Rickettsiales bacterium]